MPPAAGIATIPEGVIVISGARVCTGVLVSSLSHATHTRLTRLKSANNFLIFIYLFLSLFGVGDRSAHNVNLANRASVAHLNLVVMDALDIYIDIVTARDMLYNHLAIL